MKRRDLLLDTAVAAGGGVAWGLCFGREASVWLGWVALVPLLYLLDRRSAADRGTRRAAFLGLVHGFATWLVATPWIPPTMVTFGHLHPALGWALFALMCTYLGLYHAAFAVLVRTGGTHGTLWALTAAAAVWVLLEWLRGNALGSLSFPWNLAAYAWVEVPGALPLAAWIGPYGISFLVLLTNAGLARSVARRSVVPGAAAVAAAVALLALAAQLSRPGEDPATDAERPVRIVQPNQEILLSSESTALARSYAAMIRASEAECRGEPTLLVWPESAVWPHSWEGSFALRRDLRRLASRGCGVVFNTPIFESREVYYNSALLVAPGGGVARYDKRLLVPWGEHVPLGDLFPFIGHLARMAGTFTAGKSVALLPWDDERLGMALCYEVVFPEAMAEATRAGATLLVNISNDAWYGDSSAPRQLLRAARFRAAESRRVMLRSALTGISAVVGRRGEVLSRLELGTRGVLRHRVAGSRELTPYVRAPWLVPLACALVAVSAIFRGWKEKRRRRDDTDGADGTI